MAALTRKLAREYSLLYESCLIRPNRKAAVARIARRLTANRARYEKVAGTLEMPVVRRRRDPHAWSRAATSRGTSTTATR